MTREILFRGYCPDEKRWVYGYYLKHKGCPEEGIEGCDAIGEPQKDLWFDWKEIDPLTLGQYSGFKDRYSISHPCDVVRESRNSPCLTAQVGGNKIPCIIGDIAEPKGSTCYGLGSLQAHQNPMKEKGATVTCMHQPPPSNGYLRKLTPLECERLQGLPDGWTEGGSNTARYKAIGNGMAQPCADFVMWCAMKILEEK